MTSQNNGKIDMWVITDNLSDILARAEASDIEAARDALASIAHCLSTQNINPQTGEPLPVPAYVRDYLSRAFYAMANGEDAEKALHLQTTTGKPNVPYSVKKLMAYLVHQAMNDGGMGKLAACDHTANAINEMGKRGELSGIWAELSGRGWYTQKQVYNWYSELEAEIEKICSEIAGGEFPQTPSPLPE